MASLVAPATGPPHLPSSPIPQIDGLQVLRAVAVLIILWAHANLFCTGLGYPSRPTLGIFGIDIFFVLSGFIMALIVLHIRRPPGPAAAWAFLKRRLLRILPMWWFVSLLVYARITHSDHHFDPRYIPTLLLLPMPSFPHVYELIGGGWTLIFEMFFYLTLSIALLFTVRRAPLGVLAFFALTMVLGLAIGIHRPVVVIASNPIIFEFLFGILVALAFHRLGHRRTPGITLLILGSALAILFASLPMHGVAPGMAEILFASAWSRVATWGIAAAIIVAGTVLWSPACTGPLARLFVFIGNASYSIYLIGLVSHELVIRLVTLAFTPATLHAAHGAIELSTLTLVPLILGALIYQFAEYPTLRFLQPRFR